MDDQMTPEQAAELIAADRQRRMMACSAAIQDVLKQHRCRIDVSMVLRQGQVESQLRVVAE